MNNKKTLWTVVAVVVILVIAGGWYYMYEKKEAMEMEGTMPIPTENGDATTTETSGGAGAGLVSEVASASLDYGQAVKVYANRRIQMDDNCRLTPTNLSTKNGTTIMFDNRYRESRSFKLDGTKYTIPGYGFRLFKLTASKLPHVVDIDCGTNQNSGTIDLQ